MAAPKHEPTFPLITWGPQPNRRPLGHQGLRHHEEDGGTDDVVDTTCRLGPCSDPRRSTAGQAPDRADERKQPAVVAPQDPPAYTWRTRVHDVRLRSRSLEPQLLADRLMMAATDDSTSLGYGRNR